MEALEADDVVVQELVLHPGRAEAARPMVKALQFVEAVGDFEAVTSSRDWVRPAGVEEHMSASLLLLLQALARALKSNGSLTSLNLQRNEIDAFDAEALRPLLNRQPQPAISCPSLCCKALAEALKINGSVTQMDLDCNSIGADGAKASSCSMELFCRSRQNLRCRQALAEALKINNKITHMSLRANCIGAAGAKDWVVRRGCAEKRFAPCKALVWALKLNSGLAKINLDDNNIGIDGTKAASWWASSEHCKTQSARLLPRL